MEASFIAQIVVLLVAILVILVFLLFVNPRKKQKAKLKKAQQKTTNEPECTTLQCIFKTIKDKNSSQSELENSLDLLMRYHKNIPDKLGIRTNPEFEYYKEIFFYLCKHKNATTKMILGLDKNLSNANPSYKQEINEAIARGLAARRV
ncbi:MAG: hypothetical protein WC144_04855 [Sulfurimonas sp.]|jgi:hypothetical protein|nr:hypothetical protein [Sulfurimonadaceae bacterium]